MATWLPWDEEKVREIISGNEVGGVPPPPPRAHRQGVLMV
jgi:hypothetical protein